MDEGWDAVIEIERCESGRFAAVLVFTLPPTLGLPIRVPIEGEYNLAELAKVAALDALAAMSQGN